MFRALISQYLRIKVVFSKIIFLKFLERSQRRVKRPLEIARMFCINKRDPAGLVLKKVDDVMCFF